MKAIRTRYHGPTDYKGSRISAEVNDGSRVARLYLSLDCALSTEENHKAAALAMCTKMNWTGKMTPGWFGNDCYWVF